MPTTPAAVRQPTDHKPKAKKKPATKRPAGLSEGEAIAVASTMIAPALLAPDPRYERVNDGCDLLYHSRRGLDVLMPLDIPLDTVVEAIELDGNIDDPRQAINFLRRLAGDDILKLGALELMPVFERWTAELAAAMGGSVGESSSSPA